MVAYLGSGTGGRDCEDVNGLLERLQEQQTSAHCDSERAECKEEYRHTLPYQHGVSLKAFLSFLLSAVEIIQYLHSEKHYFVTGRR